MHPHTSYLIMATPRSGSYLLCEALITTRLAGRPTEYFGLHQTKMLLRNWGLSNYAECFARIREEGTTPNGVFGAKVIWRFLPDLVGHLQEMAGDEKLLLPELLSAAFPNLHYIWITRRDKVRQAISYWKAFQTRDWLDLDSVNHQLSAPMIAQWQALQDSAGMESPYVPSKAGEVTFNFTAIDQLRQSLEQDEVEMQQYFTACGVQPFQVVYEDFVHSYEQTALQILDYLQIPVPEKLVFGARELKKQSNEQSEEWLQRYYQLKQQEEAENGGTGQAQGTVPTAPVRNETGIEIMQGSAAQAYLLANFQPLGRREEVWLATPPPSKLYRNCEQIPLGEASPTTTDREQPTEGDKPLPSHLSREQIGQILADIYGYTRQEYRGFQFLRSEEVHAQELFTSLLRPVPSGGALYPCEVYLLVGPGQALPVGLYHYDEAHHALDILGQGDSSPLLQSALAHPVGTPSPYTFLLSCFFWKDGFNYGAFSYRLQGLDIGTVIAQSEIITSHAGLSATIHYQFLDRALDDLLGLDPLQESVYAVVTLSSTSRAARSVAETPSAHASRQEEPVLAPSVSAWVGATSTPLESIARWPLVEAVHRASLSETREAFRALRSLPPIKPPERLESSTLSASEHPLDLWGARHQRRSAGGHFLPMPLTEQQLSQLLLMSMHGTNNDLDGHAAFLQHTLLYCIVYHVKDVPSGIYVYRPEKHALELVRAGEMRSSLQDVFPWQHSNLFYMSVRLFPVGNYQRGFPVYGDRWYRLQNMEAGIIVQRLYLAAAALKLGCRASLDFSVPEIDKALGFSDGSTSLVQVMIAPERSEAHYYGQSLLI